MTTSKTQNTERLLQLLADRVTEGLDAHAELELNGLLVEHPQYDTSYFDATAATLDLAIAPPVCEPLPGYLRDRVLTDAGRTLAQMAIEDASEAKYEPLPVPVKAINSRPRGVAWLLAAACIGLAALGGWWVLEEGGQRSLTVQERYDRFVREADDVKRMAWKGQEAGYESVSGDVVWSDAEQCGFMRLVGLPLNDPRAEQYQLWIVDPTRDKHPVDGGVFDVTDSGEVFVAIDAKLKVAHPTVFAITVEQPGGVVVSDGPLVVVGSVAG